MATGVFTRRSIVAAASLCAFIAGVPYASAQGSRHATTLTFSAAVQLPGVTLPAGTYLFERLVAASATTRIDVSTLQPKKRVVTLQAVPLTRASAGEPVTYRASAAGVSPALEAWYFDGGKAGYAFVYSPTQLRALTVTPVDALALRAR